MNTMTDTSGLDRSGISLRPLFEGAQAEPVNHIYTAPLSFSAFDPAQPQAGRDVTLPDYQAVSHVIEINWELDDDAGVYHPAAHYTDTVNPSMTMVPPETAREELRDRMQSCLVCTNDGRSFLVWQHAEDFISKFENPATSYDSLELAARRQLETQAQQMSLTRAESAASALMTRSLMMHIYNPGDAEGIGVALRDYRDIVSWEAIEWEDNGNNGYVPATDYDDVINTSMSLNGADLADHGKLPEVKITLRNGQVLYGLFSSDGLAHEVEKRQRQVQDKVETFVRSVDQEYQQSMMQPQTQPAEKPGRGAPVTTL